MVFLISLDPHDLEGLATQEGAILCTMKSLATAFSDQLWFVGSKTLTVLIWRSRPEFGAWYSQSGVGFVDLSRDLLFSSKMILGHLKSVDDCPRSCPYINPMYFRGFPSLSCLTLDSAWGRETCAERRGSESILLASSRRVWQTGAVEQISHFHLMSSQRPSGWWLKPTPLKNMSSSIGMIIPTIWKNKKCSKPPTSHQNISNAHLHKTVKHDLVPNKETVKSLDWNAPIEDLMRTAPNFESLLSLRTNCHSNLFLSKAILLHIIGPERTLIAHMFQYLSICVWKYAKNRATQHDLPIFSPRKML